MSDWPQIDGVQVYLVGGAVRDQLLELPVHERDWVVVGGDEARMLAAGFRRADSEFPVFLHPDSGEEFALARTETKTGAGYKGFAVQVGPDVTLEADLRRRDLTINAMALDQQGRLIDPLHGRDDLENGRLRHISDAFIEDPVRLLRLARFAAKLGRWGFRVAHSTHRLLQQMAASDDLLSLKPERIWREMEKSLAELQPWRFFEVLQRCGALQRLLPELDTALGSSAGHAKQSETDGFAALKRATGISTESHVRFAALFYPLLGPGGDVQALVRQLRAGRAYADLLRQLQQADRGGFLAAAPEALLDTVSGLKPQQQPHRLAGFVAAAKALWPGPMQRLAPQIELACRALAEVDARQLQATGLQGAELGQALRQWRLQRLEQWLRDADLNGEESC